MKLCRSHGRFVHEVFPQIFGPDFTPEEFVTWQAYDVLDVCRSHSIDPREYDSFKELANDVESRVAKQKLKWKKIAEG